MYLNYRKHLILFSLSCVRVSIITCRLRNLDKNNRLSKSWNPRSNTTSIPVRILINRRLDKSVYTTQNKFCNSHKHVLIFYWWWNIWNQQKILNQKPIYTLTKIFLEFVSLPNLSLDTSSSHIMGHFGTESWK